MLKEKEKQKNRDLYEDYLKDDFEDRNQKHIVTVYRNREVIFQERIPAFIDLGHYQVWGEYQLILMWEDSETYGSREDFHADGLHGMYSSNFVRFTCNDTHTSVTFRDGENDIAVSIHGFDS